MTPSELAIRLDGTEYPFNVPKNLLDDAKKSDLVIVAGYSDDTAEFHGAITGSLGIKGGDVFHLAASGIIDPETNKGRSVPITAKWDKFGYHWFFSTPIKHEVFSVLEDGENYCVGLVFSVKWLSSLDFGVSYLDKDGKSVVDKGMTIDEAAMLQKSVGGFVVRFDGDLAEAVL